VEDGVNRIDTAPTLALVPGALIALTVLSLNLLGDGVRRALDPYARRHAYVKQA
jgi:ABC-type dipeptide/oligopeptide/nickel transport system permease subunit